MYFMINKAKYGLAIISTIFLISGIIWIEENRIGQPLDIDEAGYQSIAISQYHALKYSGVSGWLASLCAPSIQAPLVTATTSLIYYFTGINEHVAFLLQLLCSVGTIIITYLIATRLANSRAGIIAALLIASCPGIIFYSRSYNFVSETTLIFTCAIYSLIRSQCFTDIKWSFYFGFLLGLMPLTRTMTIAFMPGFVVGGILLVVIRNDDRLRRLCLMLSSLFIGLIVALTWYYYNGKIVLDYLQGYGYGAHANEYAIKKSRNAIINTIIILCNSAGLHFLHLLILFISFAIFFYWILRILSKKTKTNNTKQSCVLSIIVIIVSSFVALQSSENVGSGFYCPIFPSIFAIIASIVINSTTNFKIQSIYIGLACTLYVITSLPYLSLRLKIADPVDINIPYIGILKFTDGSGSLLSYLKAGKIALDSDNRLTQKRGREWLEFDKILAGEIDTFQKEKTIVVFAFRHHLCNVNTVNLQELKTRRKAFSMEMVDPALIPNSLTGYENWVQSKKNCKRIIITSSGSGTFEPLVNPVFMREALDRCGFLELAKIQSPDGQYVTLWSNERG